MASSSIKTDKDKPIINFQTTSDLTDYYCPFCNQKLFRGKVAHFNMVCSNCNQLVRSLDNDKKENKE
ncbi:MAG: hypothetical protein GY699_13880 [Desulfobacteraceae bacterium]|nr:hypothetical protein [Desulfobacteraceae bacterium]